LVLVWGGWEMPEVSKHVSTELVSSVGLIYETFAVSTLAIKLK